MNKFTIRIYTKLKTLFHFLFKKNILIPIKVLFQILPNLQRHTVPRGFWPPHPPKSRF